MSACRRLHRYMADCRSMGLCHCTGRSRECSRRAAFRTGHWSYCRATRYSSRRGRRKSLPQRSNRGSRACRARLPHSQRPFHRILWGRPRRFEACAARARTRPPQARRQSLSAPRAGLSRCRAGVPGRRIVDRPTIAPFRVPPHRSTMKESPRTPPANCAVRATRGGQGARQSSRYSAHESRNFMFVTTIFIVKRLMNESS